jgi:hypothetical protein
MTLAPVAPAPGQECVRECPLPLWDACQRLILAKGWIHDSLRLFVGGTPGPEKPVCVRVATRSDGSTRGQPDGPAWLQATTRRASAVPLAPCGVPRDPYLAGKAAA